MKFHLFRLFFSSLFATVFLFNGLTTSFAAPPAGTNVSNNTNGLAKTDLSAGSTNQAIIGFSISGTVANTMTSVTFPLNSTPVGKFVNPRLFSSTDNTFATTADNTNIGGTVNVTATNIQFTGLNQTIDNTVRYYYLVVDINPAVTTSTPTIRPSLTQANIGMTTANVNNFSITGQTYSFYQFCTGDVPTHNVNLTGQPGGSWLSPSDSRKGICCGLNPDSPDNLRCVEFLVTLDPGSQGIRFEIATGAEPSGSMGWQLECTLPEKPVGQDICLDGVGPHRVTFCKPGNNPNSYRIVSIPRPQVSPPVVVSDGCTSTLTATGYNVASIVWTAVGASPDPNQALTPAQTTLYNSYLSCTNACPVVTARYQVGAPDYVDYRVSGTPLGGCDLTPVSFTTRVYFVNDKTATIMPLEPTICFGGTHTTITAVGTGGAPPYTYEWSTGETTQSINVSSVGTYSVIIRDTTSCPAATASRNVTAYLSPITANAGPDVNSCSNNANVVLNGSVSQATGGIWSGGAGSYQPNNTSLVATYVPTPAEISAGNPISHTLTTTGNGSCPAESDQAIQTITPAPTVNIGGNRSLCANNANVAFNPVIANNPTSVQWVGGAGTFFPDRNTAVATYTPTATEISNGSVQLTLVVSKTGCNNVSDQATITFTPAPTATAGANQTVCYNNANVSLNGNVTIAGGGQWTTSGTGTFANANSTITTYTPSDADKNNGPITLTLTTTSNNNCLAVSSQMQVSFTPAPTISAGPNRTVCRNNADVALSGNVTVATGGVWTTSGSGTFSNANALQTTYTPSEAEKSGVVTLTLTSTGHGNCSAVTSQMQISFTASPTANAGANQSRCSNNPNVTLNGAVTIATGGEWTSSGSGSFANSGALATTYLPSATDISNGNVVLTLTTTGNGTCNPVSSPMTVNFTASPTANTGGNRTICADLNSITLNGAVTVAGGGQWTTSGTGTFSNANALNTTYTPSAQDRTNGNVTLTLTTTSNDNCNAVQNSMLLTITPAPTVSAGANRLVCANNPSVVLNGNVTVATGGTWSGGSGTFSPNANTLNATYTPSQAEINAGQANLTLTTTGSGSCQEVSSNMTITITPAPTANAGDDVFLCANNPNVSLAGAVTIAGGGQWSGTGGTFVPSVNDLNATYIPSQAEINSMFAQLILTTTDNNLCLPVRDTIFVVFNPAPTVNAGAPRSICSNNPAIALNPTITGNFATAQWSGGAGTYSPNSTTAISTYTPTAQEISSGNMNLTLTVLESGCLPVSSQLSITFTPAPTVNPGPTRTVCANNPAVNLSGEVTVATGGTWSGGNGTFNPGAANLITTYTPSATEISNGSLTLTLTSTNNGNCLAVSQPLTINITPAPTSNAGANQSVCANNATAVLSGSVGVVTGGVWSTSGTGTFSPINNTLNASYFPSDADKTAGNVTLTLTTSDNGNCLPVQSSKILTITPAPVANSGGATSICANRASLALNGNVTVSTGGTWTGGAGTFSPDANTLNATYTPSAAEINNRSFTLTLVTTGNGNCNFVSDNLAVTITEAPTVSAGSDLTVCGNVNSVALQGSVTIATGGTWTSTGTGSFSPNANTVAASYVPSAADKTAGNSILLTLTSSGNGNCNAVSDQMTMSFTGVPEIQAGPNKTVCTNDLPIVLEGVGSPAVWSGGNGTYSPNANTLNASYQPSSAEITAGQVTLTLTTIPFGACPAISDNVTISIPQGPVVSAGGNQTVCGDVTGVQLIGNVQNAGAGLWSSTGTGTFSPSNSALTVTYNPSAADRTVGNVTLRLTSDQNGFCSPESNTMVLTITPPPTINAGPPQTVCADVAGVQLAGTVTVATGATWTTSGSGNFLPNNTTLNATYDPSDADTLAGSVTLTLTSTGNGTCQAVSSNMVITITDAPTANAGANQTVCSDVDFIVLSGTVTTATGGRWSTTGSGTFSPNDVSLTTSYYPSAADRSLTSLTFTLTSTGNGTCNPVSRNTVVTITPKPVVNAGTDVTVCADVNNVVLNAASVSNASGGTWTTDGTGSFDDNAVVNATYQLSNADKTKGIVVLTLQSTGSGICAAVTDQMIITVTPAPTAGVGPNRTVCADVGSVPLSGNISIATGGIWSTSGSGTFVPNNTTLNASYQPSNADTTAKLVTITLTSTGNGTCNAVTSSFDLSITPVPVINLGAAATICADSSFVPLSASVLHATGGTWSSSGNGSFAPNANTLNASYYPGGNDITSGNVTLTFTSSGHGTCNAVQATKQVTITPAPTANAGGNLTVCADITGIPLNGQVTIAGGGIWSTTGTGSFQPDNTTLTATYVPSQADKNAGSVTLTLTTTNSGTCKNVSSNKIITITPAPTVNAGPDLSVCADRNSVNLNGSVTVATGGTWTTSGSGTFSPDANQLLVNYFPSAADRTSGNVTLTLTSTGNGTCNAVTSSMNLQITPAPTINAGGNQTVCADVTGVSIAGNVTVAGGGRWTTTGTGSFAPNDISLTATYVPSAADKSAGGVTLTLTSTDNGSCNAVTSQSVITISPAPTANAGLNQNVCANTSGVALTGFVTTATGGVWSTASGTGTFIPNANTLNATFVPSALQINAGVANLTLTTTGNGTCAAVTSTMRINLQPVPVVSAGPDQDVCASVNSVPLNASMSNAGGVQWSTSGSGTFLPNATTLLATYQPSAADKIAGQVNLSIATTGNANCAAATHSMTLRFTPVPSVDAGPEAVCSNAANIPLSGTVAIASGVTWSTLGTGTFSSTTSLNTSYTPSADDITAQTVRVVITSTGNASCAPARDTIILSLVPPPVANAGNDRIRCANAGGVALNGSVIGATGGTWSSTGGGTFSPNANTLNATYTPSFADISNGTAVLTLTTTGIGLCNPHSDNMEITITPAPTANAGANETFCADVVSVPLTGNVTVATGGSWTTSGSGTFINQNSLNATYQPSAADKNGNVTLTLTTTGNGGCVAVTSQKVISFTPAPTASAGPDITICADANALFIDGSATVATGATWTTNGTGTFTAVADPYDIRYVMSANDKTSGLVTLTMTTTGNGTCNPVSSSMNLTITPAPSISASAASSCSDSPSIPLIVNTTVVTQGVWTTSGSGTFDPNTTTLNVTYEPSDMDIEEKIVTLIVTSTDHGICEAVKDTVVLNIIPAPKADAGPDQIVCSDVTGVVLAGNLDNANVGLWTTSGTGSFLPNANALDATYVPSAADTTAGSVTLTLTTVDNGICNAHSDQMVITLTDAPTVEAGPAIICITGTAVELSGRITTATQATWSTTNGTGNFTNNVNDLNVTYNLSLADQGLGSITIRLTTTGGLGTCNPVQDNITVNIADAPRAIAGAPIEICADAANVTLNGGLHISTTGVWTTTGTGTFDDATKTNAVYTPSNADTAAHSVKLVLTTTDNGVCGPHSDTLNLTIKPKPIVSAGPASICADQINIPIAGSVLHAGGGRWTTSGSGSFANDGSLSTTYSPSNNDRDDQVVTLTLTSENHGSCNAVSSTMTLNLRPAPTANAGGPLTICADRDQININGSIGGIATGGLWSTSGSGTFSPNNDPVTIYNISQADKDAGSVVLTLRSTGNGVCNEAVSTAAITITPAPVVNPGSDITICADAVNVNLNGNITAGATQGTWTSSGDGSFGDANMLTTTYAPGVNDRQVNGTNNVVLLTLTTTNHGICNAVARTINLTITPTPTIDAGPASVCSDAPGIRLTGMATVATGGSWTTSGDGNFAPNANSLIVTYIPGDQDRIDGVVNLAVVSTGHGTCNAVNDNITLNLVPAPRVDLGADRIICRDNNTITLNSALIGATGIQWSHNGAGSFNSNTASAPVYSIDPADKTAGSVLFTAVTTGNGPCNQHEDQMLLTFTNAPTADAGGPVTICADTRTIPVNATVTVASGGNWTTSGTGTFSPSANSLNATYIASDSDTLAGTITLTLTTTGNGNCSAVSSNKVITITDAPTVNPGSDRTVCENTTGVPLTGAITVAGGGQWITSGGGTFNPSDVAMNATYVPSAADILDSVVVITLRTTNNGLCQEHSRNFTLYINPQPKVFAGFDQTVCGDAGTIPVSGTVTLASGGTWSSLGTGTFADDASLQTTYTLTTADTTAGAVTLRLTSAAFESCAPVVDEVVVTITDAPAINAGNDHVICADSSRIQFNVQYTVASGVEWRSSGTGVFSPNAFVDNPVYFPSAADTTAGTVTITALSTGNGTCGPVQSSFDITINPVPLVFAGQDITVCADAGTVNLSGIVLNATGGTWSGGAGSFADANNLNTTYNIAPQDITAGNVVLALTSTGMGTCNPVTDYIRITITPAPTINAGPSQTICADASGVALNGSVTVAGGAVWSTSGSGSFIPDANTLIATYVPDNSEKPGNVTLTLTSTANGLCNAVTSQMQVTITPAPTASTGSDLTICADSDGAPISGVITVAAGGLWTTSGSGIFSPSPTALNATYVPSATDIVLGTVSLTLTTQGNGSCNPVSSSKVITITPLPTVAAGSDKTICADANSVAISGSVTFASGGQWSTSGSGTFVNINSLNTSYQPSAADRTSGVVRLTLTTMGTGNCKTYTDDLLVNITPAPTINVGPAQLICADAGTISLNASVTIASGVSWSTNGTGVFAPSFQGLNTGYLLSAADTTARIVTLIATSTGNGLCNAVTASKVFTIAPAPVVRGGSASMCADQNGVGLTGSVANAQGGRWTTSGTGTFAPNAFTLNASYFPSAADMANGKATLTLSSEGNGTCNPVTSQFNLIITPLPIADAGPDIHVCRGNSAQLVARATNDVRYSWYTINNVLIADTFIINVIANSDTSFILRVVDSKGCEVSDIINVNVVDPPVFALNDQVCYERNLVLNAQPNPVPAFGVYQWYRGDTLLFNQTLTTHTVQKFGTHKIEYSFDRCRVSDQIDVTPAPILNAQDKITCTGSPVTITVASIPATGMTYSWTHNGAALGNNAASITFNALADSNYYHVSVSDGFGCTSRDTIRVYGAPVPVMAIEDQQACIFETVILDARPVNIANIDALNPVYVWHIDDQLSQHSKDSLHTTKPGKFKVELTIGECSTSDSSVVRFNPLPIPDNEWTVRYCKESDGSKALDAGPATSYLWLATGGTGRTEVFTDPGVYYFRIFNEFSCSVIDSMELRDVCPPRLFVPNAFLPDQAAPNNRFEVFGRYFAGYSMTIFNRWGEIIFYTEDPEHFWDGNYLGEPMPAGVYPYIIKFRGIGEEDKGSMDKKGSVTLIR
ncbi:MAG: gliding motility-associated C-terminal domain-containing protein [Cytophagaceae bacterium]